MGAVLVIRSFPAQPVEDLESSIDEVKETECQSDCKRGTFAMKDPGLNVRGLIIVPNEVEQFISEASDKYSPLTAVKCVKENVVETHEYDEKIGDIQSKLNWTEKLLGISNLRNDKETPVPIAAEALASAQEEGGQKECPKCFSKIAVDCLQSISCPVCHLEGFLLTKAQKKLIGELRERRIALREELSSALKDRNAEIRTKASARTLQNDEWVWIVGGWCAE